MASDGKRHLSDVMIPVFFLLPGRRRFSREEYRELSRLLRTQTRALMRKPTYVMGFLISFGLSGYFLFRAFLSSPMGWWSLVIALLISFGYTCGINSTREHLCETLLRLKQRSE